MEQSDLGSQWLTDSKAAGDELQDRKLRASASAHPYKDGQFTSSFILRGIEFIKWVESYLQQAQLVNIAVLTKIQVLIWRNLPPAKGNNAVWVIKWIEAQEADHSSEGKQQVTR